MLTITQSPHGAIISTPAGDILVSELITSKATGTSVVTLNVERCLRSAGVECQAVYSGRTPASIREVKQGSAKRD